MIDPNEIAEPKPVPDRNVEIMNMAIATVFLVFVAPFVLGMAVFLLTY